MYWRVKTITLEVDNVIIHKSHKVEHCVTDNKNLQLLFLSTYSPWRNPVARRWLSWQGTPLSNTCGSD